MINRDNLTSACIYGIYAAFLLLALTVIGAMA